VRPFMRGAWWLPFIFSEGGINASVTGVVWDGRVYGLMGAEGVCCEGFAV